MYLSITSCIVSQILIEWITYFCVISNRSRTSLIKLNVYSLSVRVLLSLEARIMLAAVLPALKEWGGGAAWHSTLGSAGSIRGTRADMTLTNFPTRG